MRPTVVTNNKEQTTTEGGRRPRKVCSVCGRNTASAYYWWLEESNVRFMCRECRDSRGAAPRLSAAHAAVDPLLELDDEL